MIPPRLQSHQALAVSLSDKRVWYHVAKFFFSICPNALVDTNFSDFFREVLRTRNLNRVCAFPKSVRSLVVEWDKLAARGIPESRAEDCSFAMRRGRRKHSALPVRCRSGGESEHSDFFRWHEESPRGCVTIWKLPCRGLKEFRARARR